MGWFSKTKPAEEKNVYSVGHISTGEWASMVHSTEATAGEVGSLRAEYADLVRLVGERTARIAALENAHTKLKADLEDLCANGLKIKHVREEITVTEERKVFKGIFGEEFEVIQVPHEPQVINKYVLLDGKRDGSGRFQK